jgi:hypothetical protein
MTAWGVGSKADIDEWYVENQGAQISLSFARSFVDPLLKRLQA